jgi:hypothetical protein
VSGTGSDLKSKHELVANTTLSRYDTPITKYLGIEAAFKVIVGKLRDAWEKKVPLTFSTDFDYWNS